MLVEEKRGDFLGMFIYLVIGSTSVRCRCFCLAAAERSFSVFVHAKHRHSVSPPFTYSANPPLGSATQSSSFLWALSILHCCVASYVPSHQIPNDQSSESSSFRVSPKVSLTQH